MQGHDSVPDHGDVFTQRTSALAELNNLTVALVTLTGDADISD